MSELYEAVAQVAELIESLKQARHRQHLEPSRAKLKKMILRRWQKQQRALLYALDAWMRKQSIQEADAALLAKLQAAVTAKLRATAAFDREPSAADSAIYDAAVETAMLGAIKNISADLAIDIARDKGQAFIRGYLDEHGFAKIAKDVDTVTKERVRDALAQQFSSGGTYQDGVRAIKDVLGDEKRADVIARTELADAYNQAILQSGREVDGSKKQWNTDGPDPCDECIANEDQGEIDIDDDFQSGDDAPPLHPNCWCSVSIIMPDGEEE